MFYRFSNKKAKVEVHMTSLRQQISQTPTRRSKTWEAETTFDGASDIRYDTCKNDITKVFVADFKIFEWLV